MGRRSDDLSAGTERWNVGSCRVLMQIYVPHEQCEGLTPPHTYPFLPPVKNILTTKTCKPAIPTINPLSSRLKLNIRFSVLLTVLKFLFSLVLKYFCCLVSVEIWPDRRSTVSSTPDSCSGDAPVFCGRLARGSSSTCGFCQ